MSHTNYTEPNPRLFFNWIFSNLTILLESSEKTRFELFPNDINELFSSLNASDPYRRIIQRKCSVNVKIIDPIRVYRLSLVFYRY